jgi:hypothetical protein
LGEFKEPEIPAHLKDALQYEKARFLTLFGEDMTPARVREWLDEQLAPAQEPAVESQDERERRVERELEAERAAESNELNDRWYQTGEEDR